MNPTELRKLIIDLQSIFPNELPEGEININKLHIQVGNQQVIRYLLGALEKLERKSK